MDLDQATPLLGGLSPKRFMARHWQRKPLLVRQAWPGVAPPLDRTALFALAGRDGVESRLLERHDGRWRLRHGPFARRALPPVACPNWTLLVQGLDLHLDAAHAMLAQFRFVPEARLDDLMISYATDGGGVGPHLDSYDVFLLQVHGRRRWRIGRVKDRTLVPGLPVKILANFQPEQEWLLEPGDMLYLPPLWGHDGIAEGECMTCSVGFRAATAREVAGDLLAALGEAFDGRAAERIYTDPGAAPTATPGAVPASLRAFADSAVRAALREPHALDRALGQWLTEPKPQVWFDAGTGRLRAGAGVRLDRRSRMMYDRRHVFLNGEAFVAAGRDARLMHRLADARCLDAKALVGLGAQARQLMDDWLEAGWLHAE